MRSLLLFVPCVYINMRFWLRPDAASGGDGMLYTSIVVRMPLQVEIGNFV